jgi:stringent starvation protein B
MPSETLPNKREVMLALLAEASVFIHLDPRGPGVRVPPWFKNQPQLVLQVGLNMAVPIPDLDVGEPGITCTLSFSRRPFFCSIPWKAVFGLVGEGGPGLVWPDDVPVEVAAQVQAQGQKQPGQKQPGQKSQSKKPDGAEPGRARLRAVGSEPAPAPAAEPSPSASTAETPSGGAPVAPAPALVPAPAPALAPAPAAPTQASETEGASEDAAPSESDRDAVKPLRPAAGKPGAKRDLPPYLRVVK